MKCYHVEGDDERARLSWNFCKGGLTVSGLLVWVSPNAATFQTNMFLARQIARSLK